MATYITKRIGVIANGHFMRKKPIASSDPLCPRWSILNHMVLLF